MVKKLLPKSDLSGRNAKGQTALMVAIDRYPEAVDLFLPANVGRDTDAQGLTVPMQLIRRDWDVEWLAKVGDIDVDAQDAEGLTALMHAVMKDDIDWVRALLDLGADVTLRDLKGKSASNHAREWGGEEVRDWLDGHIARKFEKMQLEQATLAKPTSTKADAVAPAIETTPSADTAKAPSVKRGGRL